MSFSWPRPWPRTFSRYWEEQTGAAVLPKLWLSFLAVMPAHFSVSYTSAWWLTQPPYVIKKIITVSSFYLIAVIHQFEVRRLTQPYRKCVSKSHFPVLSYQSLPHDILHDEWWVYCTHSEWSFLAGRHTCMTTSSIVRPNLPETAGTAQHLCRFISTSR